MSTPAYDGKEQPPVTTGWFSGLTDWFNHLTPAYVAAPTRIVGKASARAESVSKVPVQTDPETPTTTEP